MRKRRVLSRLATKRIGTPQPVGEEHEVRRGVLTIFSNKEGYTLGFAMWLSPPVCAYFFTPLVALRAPRLPAAGCQYLLRMYTSYTRRLRTGLYYVTLSGFNAGVIPL